MALFNNSASVQGLNRNRTEKYALGKDFCEVCDRAEDVLRRLGRASDHRVTLDLGLFRLLLPLLLVTELFLLALLVRRRAESVLLRHLVQVLLFVIEVVIVIVVVRLVDVHLATDVGVTLTTSSFTTDDYASAKALDQVRKLPCLFFDLFGARAVLDRVVDPCDQALVALLVQRVGGGRGNAGRRGYRREENLARSWVGNETGLRRGFQSQRVCHSIYRADRDSR